MSHPLKETPEVLQRRELLRRVAWMIGGAVSAPAALAILQGCSAKDAPAAADWKPKFFQGKQAQVVSVIADIILPKGDTSGALDANVPQFIDLMLADVYDAPAQDRFNAGFAEFEARASSSGKAFLDRDGASRTGYVKEALEAALTADNAGGKPFILMTRELTLLGFYTSRPGITENFEYQAVPGAYHGCVNIADMKKPVYWE
jgi:hypothetical protein